MNLIGPLGHSPSARAGAAKAAATHPASMPRRRTMIIDFLPVLLGKSLLQGHAHRKALIPPGGQPY
jgi:hypothetical protein